MTEPLVLGPRGFDKIAIIGSAPSSIDLAPYADPSWAIWVCSPGAFATVAKKRSDVWFETHRFQPSLPGRAGEPGTKPWFSPEFHQFLRDHKGPVFMSEVHASIPNSVRLPFEALIDKYGPYHFTSSVAWMLALAIDQRPKMLGLWGIDMSATEEYNYQRPGCQHFLGMAKAMGIGIVLPAESDLMRPTMMYGIGELSPRYIKLNTRLEQFHKDRGVFRQQIQHFQIQDAYVSGAIDATTYDIQTWSDDVKVDIAKAMSFSSEYGKPVGQASHPPAIAAPAPEPLAAEPVKVRKPRQTKAQKAAIAAAPQAGNGADHSGVFNGNA